MKLLILLIICMILQMSIFSQSLEAVIKLPSIFGNNMVLQQQTEVSFWGSAEKNSTVKVSTSWNHKVFTTRSGVDGKWRLKVVTPIAGGPYEVSVSDGKILKLRNVMIGEVWICSGQSNMEMPVKGRINQPVTGSNEAIITSSNPEIRLFTVKRSCNLQPLDDFSGSWKSCEPENVSEFSATAYFFGLMLNKALKISIGLISSCWGGTRIEPWISENGIKKFDYIKLPDKNQQGTLSQQIPTVLFNAMINPMAGYGIKGVIWYQGESNRTEPDKYVHLLPGMIEDWRSVWGVGNFPFYYLQIAPHDYGKTGFNSAYMREAQLMASTVIPNIGIASIMDVGEKGCIHPANKKTGADRLAFLALAKTYGKTGFESSGPVLKEMNIVGPVVKLTFNHAANGLTSYGKELTCFEIAGANKRFYPAKAIITGTGVSVFSFSVSDPVSIRYAFKDFIVGDLFNTEGLPASSFRTDDWAVE